MLKKFDNILLVTDLDGTLLDDDKSISAKNKQAIEYFMAEGGKFTFITGRLPISIKPLCEQINPNAPIGCINGGGIFDSKKQELMWSISLPESALELVAYVDETMPHMGIELMSHENIYFSKKNAATDKHQADESLPDLCCHYTKLEVPMAKVLFADAAEEIEKLEQLLTAHPASQAFDLIRSERHYYEILPKGATKGNVALRLAQLFDIDQSHIIAVGDNDNDVSMIQAAGIGYAVANASERAKAAADHITVSNREHAIARIIDDIDRDRIAF